MGTTGVDLWLYPISEEQHRAASDYLSGPLPESPHHGGTSSGVMVPDPLLPFEHLGSAYIEALLGTGDPASTPSASLAQDYDPSPVGTTQTGAHQPGPPSSWPSQINGTTTSATTTPGDPKQCPACQAHFNRKQDCDRHIVTHLPHWIHCPFPNCTWRGNRVKPSFKTHWENDHGSHGHHIPGREQFEIFNTQEFVNQIKAGTTLLVVADRAIERVRARAHQLGKMSMLTDPWGWTFKQPPQ